MKGVAKTSKDYKKDEKRPEVFQRLFLCSHLSTLLNRNLEADLQLSCLSQMSMIVIFVPCMNKSLIGKRLASLCSVSVDDVPNGVSGIFLAHLPDFLKEMVWFKRAETEDLVKGLGEFIQKLDVVSAVIFTLVDVKGESKSKQQQPCYFCYDHFSDSVWNPCRGIISFLKIIVEYYNMEWSLSPMRPVCYIIPTNETYF